MWPAGAPDGSVCNCVADRAWPNSASSNGVRVDEPAVSGRVVVDQNETGAAQPRYDPPRSAIAN